MEAPVVCDPGCVGLLVAPAVGAVEAAVAGVDNG
jgi:hypothetical protein